MLGFLNALCVGLCAELPEHRRHASPPAVLVDDSVMNQECRMQQLNCGSDFERCFPGPAPASTGPGKTRPPLMIPHRLQAPRGARANPFPTDSGKGIPRHRSQGVIGETR